MPIYFYKCPDLLEPGDVVRNGNWGRKIFGIGVTHPHFYREMLFEAVRAAEFPNLPKRMESAFLFEDGLFAANWKRQGHHELLYRVVLQDPTATLHGFDMKWFGVLETQHATSFAEAEQTIRRYWSGEHTQQPAIELLASCPLVVQQRLHPVPTQQVERTCRSCGATVGSVPELTPVCLICRTLYPV